MDFVTSHFGKMNLRAVEHFFQHICHHFGMGLLLLRGSSFQNDLLQNTYSHLSNKRDVILTDFEKFHPPQKKFPLHVY